MYDVQRIESNSHISLTLCRGWREALDGVPRVVVDIVIFLGLFGGLLLGRHVLGARHLRGRPGRRLRDRDSYLVDCRESV